MLPNMFPPFPSAWSTSHCRANCAIELKHWAVRPAWEWDNVNRNHELVQFLFDHMLYLWIFFGLIYHCKQKNNNEWPLWNIWYFELFFVLSPTYLSFHLFLSRDSRKRLVIIASLFSAIFLNNFLSGSMLIIVSVCCCLYCRFQFDNFFKTR